MNWDRPRSNRPSQLKYEDGAELKNGTVFSAPKDSLARRAASAEKRWLKQNKMETIYDRPRGKRKKQKHKGQTFFNKPAIFSDVVIDVLNEKD